jgi:hypothetical protein
VRPPLERAYAIRRRLAPGSLLDAASAQLLGRAWETNDDMKVPPDVRRARDLYARAATIRRRLAPASYDETVSRYRLAMLTMSSRLVRTIAERDRRLADLRRAMTRIERWIGPGRELAYIALYAADVLKSAAKPAEAERLDGLAISVREGLGPQYQETNCGPCLSLPELWNGLGLAYADQWKLEDAERALEHALTLADGEPVYERS